MAAGQTDGLTADWVKVTVAAANIISEFLLPLEALRTTRVTRLRQREGRGGILLSNPPDISSSNDGLLGASDALSFAMSFRPLFFYFCPWLEMYKSIEVRAGPHSMS